MGKAILIILALLIGFILMRSAIELRRFQVNEFFIKSPKVDSEYKFVVLTDLHNRIYGRNAEKIAGAIHEIAPHHIFFVGDMVNKKNPGVREHTASLINKLAGIYNIIYVNGNHEQVFREREREDFTSYKKELINKGICFLENEMLVRDERISVYGLEVDLDYYSHFSLPRMPKDYISSLLGDPDSDRYNILLVHTPMYLNEYEEWGADLVMAGHNHGGAIRIPGLGGVVSPQGILFPKYSAGHFRKNKTDLLVSRGIGSHTVNLRVFNSPEIMLVRILPENNNGHKG